MYHMLKGIIAYGQNNFSKAMAKMDMAVEEQLYSVYNNNINCLSIF